MGLCRVGGDNGKAWAGRRVEQVLADVSVVAVLPP